MLSLPRIDPDIPLRLVPAAARQRGAHLARVLIQAGLINARTLTARMDTDPTTAGLVATVATHGLPSSVISWMSAVEMSAL